MGNRASAPALAASRSTTSPVAAWARAWGGVVLLAVVNGAIHRAYEQPLGELRAHQVSGATLLLLVAPWAWRTERRNPLRSWREAVLVGGVWAVATVSFEFVVFHYVGGTSWERLLLDYDLTKGRVWALVVAGVAAMPPAARFARLRRRTNSTGG